MKIIQTIKMLSGVVNANLFLLLCLGLLQLSCKKSSADEQKNELPPKYTTTWKAGDSFSDAKNWTECEVGNMPLIISVPHGGQLQPEELPDRECDGITTVTDLYTIELAREISDALQAQFGKRPYIISCNLKRTKIDQNRDLAEATCDNPDLADTWSLFHNYIDTALTDAHDKFGSVLYIDLHGHGHTNQRLELGYSLTHAQLRDVYMNTGLQSLWHISSLNNLKRIKSDLDFRNYMIGDLAFGTMMQARGFNSIPSKLDPYPKSNESYFNGGYNTRLYTSEDYPQVFGFQIESNYTKVRDKAGRPVFAAAFAKVVTEYLEQAIGFKP